VTLWADHPTFTRTILLKIAFHEYGNIWHDMKRAPRIIDKLRYLYMPPGWSHDGATITSEEIAEKGRELALNKKGLKAKFAKVFYFEVELLNLSRTSTRIQRRIRQFVLSVASA
jgi:hypothetical protein